MADFSRLGALREVFLRDARLLASFAFLQCYS
jgi:hypothetical protein